MLFLMKACYLLIFLDFISPNVRLERSVDDWQLAGTKFCRGLPMWTELRSALICSVFLGVGLLASADADAASKAKEKSKKPTVSAQKKVKPTASAGKASAKTTSKTTNKTASKAKSEQKSSPKVAKKQAERQKLVGNKPAQKQLARKSAKSEQLARKTPESKQASKKHTKAKQVAQKQLARKQIIETWVDGRLDVQSESALVVSQDGGETLFQKNANVVAPIASITKLMTAMVILDGAPNLQAPITVSDSDVDYLRGSRSRLPVGTSVPRETALLLALMSSENRAANALARHYPGGLSRFIAAMNEKARALGMKNTHFDDPTGLASSNVSTARDLAKMVSAAYRYPLIREFTTTPDANIDVDGRELAYHNTNPLVKNTDWEVGLSKTGYIQEAGKCLVMQARVADQPVVIVLLDSAGKMTRVVDAKRIKRWMEGAQASARQGARASLTLAVDRG